MKQKIKMDLPITFSLFAGIFTFFSLLFQNLKDSKEDEVRKKDTDSIISLQKRNNQSLQKITELQSDIIALQKSIKTLTEENTFNQNGVIDILSGGNEIQKIFTFPFFVNAETLEPLTVSDKVVLGDSKIFKNIHLIHRRFTNENEVFFENLSTKTV